MNWEYPAYSLKEIQSMLESLGGIRRIKELEDRVENMERAFDKLLEGIDCQGRYFGGGFCTLADSAMRIRKERDA